MFEWSQSQQKCAVVSRHYEVHRLAGRPFVRVCRPGDTWQRRIWDIELGAALGVA